MRGSVYLMDVVVVFMT